ncbi:MAG TPA: phosphotransferase [Ornithinibacter sp.]|nr:phosphotransferase [Ornithinibacter sp.]
MTGAPVVSGGHEAPSAEYLALDDDEQVEALRVAALQACDGFGLSVRGLSLVLHAYNTTFRLDTDDGRSLALRVNTNSHSAPEHIVAQQEWLHAIATQTPVRVPDPLRTPDGRWSVEVECPPWGAPLRATVASWLDGEDVGTCDEDQGRALGEAMALLHDHALRFEVPPGGALPVHDHPLCGDEDLLTGHPDLPRGGARVIASALDELTTVCAAAHDLGPAIVIHADLHGANLKWLDGRLSVFDVDDCGIGVPALDLAIATFYLRSGEPADAAVEAAVRDGYAGIRPLPEIDPAHFEALVAARQLLLANSLLTSATAGLRAEAVDYLGVTVDRLLQWRATGRFSRGAAAGR